MFVFWDFPFSSSSVSINIFSSSILYFNMDVCLYCHISVRIICSSKPICIWELTFAYLAFVNVGSYSQQVKNAMSSLISRELCQVFFSISPGFESFQNTYQSVNVVFKSTKKQINIFQKTVNFWIGQKCLRTVNSNILCSSKLQVMQLCCAAWQFFVWKVRAGFRMCLVCCIGFLFSESWRQETKV